MTIAAARLRAAAAAMRAGVPLPADVAVAIADAFEAAVDDGADLDEALGLQRPSPFSAEAFARRDVLLMKLAYHFTGSPSGTAKMMAAAAAHFASTVWPRLQMRGVSPREDAGSARAILFELHRDAELGGASWPLAWRSIHDRLKFAMDELAIANISDAESE